MEGDWQKLHSEPRHTSGRDLAACLAMQVFGLLVLWGAWWIGHIAWAMTTATSARRTGDLIAFWWVLAGATALVGLTFLIGGVIWIYKTSRRQRY